MFMRAPCLVSTAVLPVEVLVLTTKSHGDGSKRGAVGSIACQWRRGVVDRSQCDGDKAASKLAFSDDDRARIKCEFH